MLRQYRWVHSANAFIAHLLASIPSYFTGFVGRGVALASSIVLSDEKSGGATAQQSLCGIALINPQF